MAHNGVICHIFAKKLTEELRRMTKGERAVFLLELAERWGYIRRKYRFVKPPKKKK